MQTDLATSTRARSRYDDTWVYFDGEVVRYQDVRLGPMTHALHYGTGCFEGIRAYWNGTQEQLYLLKGAAHYDRLRRSASILRLSFRSTRPSWCASTVDLLRKNGRAPTPIFGRWSSSRPKRSASAARLQQSFLIYTAPLGEYIALEGGFAASPSSWRRVSDASIPARAKVTGSYVNSALAKSEALEAGYDEAIMLAMDGHVSEGSAENLFMFKDGAFVTPPVTDDILEGITREVMIGFIRSELG